MPETKEVLSEKRIGVERWEKETLEPVLNKKAERKKSFEGVSLEAVNAACDAHLNALREHGSVERIERDTYQLQIMVTKK